MIVGDWCGRHGDEVRERRSQQTPIVELVQQSPIVGTESGRRMGGAV